MFFFMIAVVLVFAKDWEHYTRQNEVRDVVRTESGTLWAAFAWGLQERFANKTENFYMPGNNNLQAADFVQLFELPNDDIIAVSRNGILVRKNKNYKNFEIINNAFAEKKRNLLNGLGKKAENILILPFDGAIAFFDYEQNRPVITIEMPNIKRVAVRNDSIWLDLDTKVLTRAINWKKIYDDRFLADMDKWEPVDNIPFEEDAKPEYVPGNLNFPLENARTIAVSSSGEVLAWGSDFDYLSRMQNNQWGEAFLANQSNYGNDMKLWAQNVKTLALLSNGNFAIGMWGPGFIAYNAENNKTGWFHSTNSNNTCPTQHGDNANGHTIVLGATEAPDASGFLFTFLSEANYGLAFVDNNGQILCAKDENSSPAASSIISRKSENGTWEIYAAWKLSRDVKAGGIDFYLTPSNSFSPKIQKKWTTSFESPIDFAFDSKGVLWAVSSTQIFYLDKDNEWKEPSSIRGFNGGTISSLEADAQNGLWISTLGDGAYSFSQNSPDSLIAKQYKIKDGLMSENVYDIAIDTIKGKVYFAHNLGLSVYSTSLVRSASGFMRSDSRKPIAYPNPYRPGVHSGVKINYISEKSSVYILDSSGKRVRLFKGADLRGGAVVWDGKNESGKFVAPGLYYYIAADGKNTAKGKILVER